MKYILVLFVLFLFSCMDAKRDKVAVLLNKWTQKEILFPSNPVFTVQGKDTVDFVIQDKYKIVNYVDSAGCTSCKLRLSNWNKLMNYVDSVSDHSVQFLFFFFPKKGTEVFHALRAERFEYPICIDELDSLNQLNYFPQEEMFHTFLLDKNNKVLAVGNPVNNPRVKDLYIRIILGDNTPQREEKIQTTAVCSDTIASLGKFDWRQEQKATFTLTNTGNRPLVITDVITSCGCTMVDYKKEPVRTGSRVELKVQYKADHPEHFDKTITVYCNAETSPIKLRIMGSAE